MILYHTSTMEIRQPDVNHSRSRLDFGKGFYLTSLRSQAEAYGQRFVRQGEPAVLNVYEFDEERPNFSYKAFAAYDGEWLDYVSACRKGLPREMFDVIDGGIADDQVFDTVDLYFSGVYNREQALSQLLYKHPNHQICITSQDVIDRHLRFVEAVRL